MRRRTVILVGLTLAQGTLGYVQYFTGLPSTLVAIHVLGAVLTWIAVLFIPFSMRTRGEPELGKSDFSKEETV
jgi:cytochrome c oxidase assembly protein subunit 15